MITYFITGFLTALFVFFSYEQNEITGTAHIPCLFILLTSLAFLVIPLLKKQAPVLQKCCSVDYAFYIFFALTAIVSSILNLWSVSGTDAAPRPAINQMSVWLAAWALWFLLRQTLQNEKIIMGVFHTLVALFFSLAILGLYQQFVDIPQMISEFNTDPAATIRKIDPSVEPGTPSFDRLADRIRTAVPMGTYPLSNTFGGILAVGAVAACWFWISYGGTKHTEMTGYKFLLKFAFFGVIFFALLLTKCRSADIAALVGFCLLIWLRYNRSVRDKMPVENAAQTAAAKILSLTGRRAQRNIGIILLICCALFLFPSQGKRILAGAKQSLGYRLEYWTASLGIIRDYPLFGCGSGNFKQTYMKYKLPQSSEEIADPHNFAVEIAAVAGIPALLFFLFAVSRVLYSAQRCKDTKTEEENKSACPLYLRIKPFYDGGLTGCWAAYLLSFLTEAPMAIAAPLAATLSFPLTALAICLVNRPVKNEIQPETAAKNEKCSVETQLFAVLILVLLIHLSAAGGISVINTLFLLLFFCAVIVNRAKSEPEAAKKVLKRTYNAVLALCAAVIIVYCFGFRPVLTAFSYSTQAASEFDINKKIGLLEKAANADEFSAVLQEQLTQNYFLLWLQQNCNNAGLEEKVFNNQEKAVRLMQRSASVHFTAAERMNFAYHQTAYAEKRKKYLETALKLYREAVERYPNYAPFRAPFALLLWEAGKKEEALRQRDKTLQLDDLMLLHKDQKLKSEQRTALEHLQRKEGD